MDMSTPIELKKFSDRLKIEIAITIASNLFQI